MTDDVFSFITRLESLAPFDEAPVAREVGVDFRRDSSPSNPLLDILTGEGSTGHLVRAAELRVRKVREAGRGGLLIIDVSPDECVDREEAMRRLGSPNEFHPPSPHGTTTPSYLVYTRPWGKLSLGFSRDEPRCLVTVVLDATGS